MVKKITKSVEIEVVQLEIEVSKKFFDHIERSKAHVEEERKENMSYGQFLEQSYDDFLIIINQYATKIRAQNEEIEALKKGQKHPESMYG